eukprot:TRINITY_DN1833_c0_g1_i1.p1 TRINITY_DN1833_c0_g1~~TRINITY_DN1833_c0_g1_i1.p1  ORF type:complete len:473 (-),score=22.30 TRINITY_DN1833_c0_g1_i1:748-2166(-)
MRNWIKRWKRCWKGSCTQRDDTNTSLDSKVDARSDQQKLDMKHSSLFETKKAKELRATKRWFLIAGITCIVVLVWVTIESNPISQEIDLETQSTVPHNQSAIGIIPKSTKQINLTKQNQYNISNQVQYVLESYGYTNVSEQNTTNDEIIGNEQNDNKFFIRKKIEGLDVLYEIPQNQDPIGILFLAHGCNRRATDFWPKSELCPDCIGQPEGMKIRKISHQMGYVFIGISSSNSVTKCWDVNTIQDTYSQDAQSVKLILNQLRDENGWNSLMLYAMGSSSGGKFVMYLSLIMSNIQGICSQGSAPQTSYVRELFDQKIDESRVFPPTVFIHMERDTKLTSLVQEVVGVFKNNSVNVQDILVPKRSINESYMHDRIDDIDIELSSKIYKALYSSELLDTQGYLKSDPRQNDVWRSVLLDEIPEIGELDSLQQDESPIAEELNVAWAQHQMISDYTSQVLKWFQDTAKNSTLLG